MRSLARCLLPFVSITPIVSALAVLSLFAMPVRAQDVIYHLDFSDYDEGSVERWLGAKGFTFKGDADDRRKMELDVSDDGLVLEATRPARAMLLNERVNLDRFDRVRINWRVDRYPNGANYDQGKRSEPVMLIVFFGHERVKSGSMLIPDSPYFIGLFPCKEGTPQKAYTGRYFQKSGRYVCVDQPPEGELTTVEFPLAKAYREIFQIESVPLVSGISLSTDSANAKDGKSRAVVASIEFLAEDL